MKEGEIMADGSVHGKTFSGDNYKGEFPKPKVGEETYADYYERCKKAANEGFHLGDLSWSHWYDYCLGSPYNEEYKQDDIIR